MGRSPTRAYPLDFRLTILKLVRAGRRIDELAIDCDIAAQTIRSWQRQTEIDAGRRDGLGRTPDDVYVNQPTEKAA